MSATRPISAATRKSQSDASHPGANAWVSANAGSGKTHVLTQRVIRLLLAGVPASKILCLTFTKSAAANMSMRVFDTLAKWTSLDDEALEAAISATGTDYRRDLLATARKLFSRTIETPGGLKIQTIHGFCESILHRFPFEANVPSGFQVIDDEIRAELLLRAKTDTFAQARVDRDVGLALDDLADRVSADDFDNLVNEALSRSNVVNEMKARADNWPRDYNKTYGAALGLAIDEDTASIESQLVGEGFSDAMLGEIAIVLDQGSAKDIKLAGAVRNVITSTAKDRRNAYLDLFFKSDGERRGVGAAKLVTKSIQQLAPALLPRLEAEADRLEPLIDKLKASATIERGQSLITVVDRILERYAELKRRSSWLDFEDLIERTWTLLSRSDSQWVLYKLDSGIDHILVDEAQDTSRRQWKILEALGGEFTSGRGRATEGRTFFAVGDEKQSIFSFQGAEPRLFDEAGRSLEKRVRDANNRFHPVRLNVSFRSAAGILGAVDGVFADPENRRGISSDDLPVIHEAWKRDLPSHVEIWDPIGAEDRQGDPDWLLPLDAIDHGDPAVILADRITNLVAGLLDPKSDERVGDDTVGSRSVGAGDIMILMRRRGVLFEALIRALKHKGLPVAGADRMTLKDHIAVMDLIALGRFCLLPQDDLALACVLKSPLIGLDDDDLMSFAPRRPGSLFDALGTSSAPSHKRAHDTLTVWRRMSRDMSPFFFYSTLLDARDRRAMMLARLGSEAGDAIDEFLRIALDREDLEAPSLASLLSHVETGAVEVKRDMEAAARSIRVMTVHAAKGLEAKIVILPDTCQTPSDRFDPKLFTLSDARVGSFLAWSPKKDMDCAAVAETRRQCQLDRMGEYRRLLYVAMTRAEERLYIMGYYKSREPPGDCWHSMIWRSLGDKLSPAPAQWDPEQTIWQWRTSGMEVATSPPSLPLPIEASPPMPEWIYTPVAKIVTPRTRVFPSGKSIRSIGRAPTNVAFEFGRAVHHLLQTLPRVGPDRRETIAGDLLGTQFPMLDLASREAVIKQSLRVINDPTLNELFSEKALAEAPIVGVVQIAPGITVEVSGRIDRLVELDDEIQFADFKTGAPDHARGRLDDHYRQIALYAAALREAFTPKKVRAFLVWTAEPEVIEMSKETLSAHLARDDQSEI